MSERDEWPMPDIQTERWNLEFVHPPLRQVILEIADERVAQRAEYGEAGDDTLEPAEWVARLVKHLGRAVTIEPRVFRTQLVRVAAICVAAIESFDRRFPE